MDSFCGLMSAVSGPKPKIEERLRKDKSMPYSIQAQGSTSALSVVATEQWSIYTTPDYHSVAVGYAQHSDLGFLSAESLARVLSDKGVDAICGVDGCYVAGQISRVTNEFILFSDPLGTRPIFYQQEGDHLAFASAAKWLAATCGVTQAVNRDEALQFLMNRFAVGYETLFLGAARLPPGHMLRFVPQKQEVRLEQYWDLQFDTGIRAVADAVESLHQVFLESHAAVFNELRSDERYRLFLTGGMDSRGILGYAERLECLPALAQTWGETDRIPDSDPVIARQLADLMGVPFEFRTVNAEDWVDHAAQWAWTGELQSDNANNYATPLDFFTEPKAHPFRFSIAGDQMLGAGPLPGTPEQAIDNILHSAKRTAAGPLSSLLNRDSYESMLGKFDDGVQHLVDRCPNSHPKDLQDYLYFHAYISRWILAPGNFKHPVLAVRRPLMTLAVVETSRHLAPELRVDKAAYIQLLQREFPHLMSVPKMATESGIDWAYHFRANDRLRDELMRLTQPEKLESLAIHDALDMDAVRLFLSEFFAEVPERTTEGGRVKRRLYDIRRHVSRIPVLGKISNTLQPMVKRMAGIRRAEDRRYRHEIVMRLALLSLFEDQVRLRGEE